MADRMNMALGENIITLLAYDDVNGKIVANMLDPNLMEGDYRVIAERSIAFWRKFHEAPKDHLADELSDILEDPHNRRAKTFARILTNMRDLSGSVNTQYVMEQLRKFMRMQRIKDAIIKSAEQLNKQQDVAIDEVEKIWNGILRTQDLHFDAGMKLWDVDRVLDFMELRQVEFPTGIPAFDRNGIVPMRGATYLLLGSAGRGKTWGLVHTGVQALKQRKRVVHISLEMSEEETAQRYYQCLFGVANKDEPQEYTTLVKDDDGNLEGFDEEKISPEWALDSKVARTELDMRLHHYGRRFDNLIIKRFPPRSVSIADIEGYLDNLEITEGFIPDMIILDYIGIIKTDERNHRISLGRQFEEFRSLGIRKNAAAVSAHQVSRVGAHSQLVSQTHVAEDWSMIATSDVIITYSSTEAEAEHGLGRLYVSKCRHARDKWGVLLVQHYATGQFIVDSAFLGRKYWDIVKELTGEDAEGKGDGVEDDEDEEKSDGKFKFKRSRN